MNRAISTGRQLARDLVGVALGGLVAWFLSDTYWRGRVENDAGTLTWP